MMFNVHVIQGVLTSYQQYVRAFCFFYLQNDIYKQNMRIRVNIFSGQLTILIVLKCIHVQAMCLSKI